MANNYQQFSFSVQLGTEAAKYAEELFKAWDAVVCDDESIHPDLRNACSDMGAELEGESISVNASVEEDGALCVWCDEWGNIEAVVKVLQHVLQKFDLPSKVGFCWADWCSKPRLDEFGGGAVAISKDGVEWLNTYDWLKEKGCTNVSH